MEYRELTEATLEKLSNGFLNMEAVRNHLQETYQHTQLFSSDPATKVGASLIPIPLSNTYYNSDEKQKHEDQYKQRIVTSNSVVFPHWKDIFSEKELQSTAKYHFLEHAERNAIFEYVLKYQKSPENCIMIAPWFACSECARTIVRFGVRGIIGHKTMLDYTPDSWKESITYAYRMFDAAGIPFYHYNGTVGANAYIRGNIINV